MGVDRLDHVANHLALPLDHSFCEVKDLIDHPLDVMGERRDEPIGVLGDALGQLAAGIEYLVLHPLDEVLDLLSQISLLDHARPFLLVDSGQCTKCCPAKGFEGREKGPVQQAYQHQRRALAGGRQGQYGACAVTHLAVTVVGSDRPGIVAAVTQVLVESRCNLDESSMTVLRGHLAMNLIVEAPPGVDPGELEAALARPAEDFGLIVTTRVIDDEVPPRPPGERWSLSVYGSDRPGMVHAVAAQLASAGVNIDDLSTRVVGGEAGPVYLMVLELTLPARCHPEVLRADLAALGSELGVEVTLHRSGADIL